MKKKIKICIVRSQYNDTSKLLQSAIDEIKKRKISYRVINVPGAFEIPVVMSKNIKKFDGFIAIGLIIKPSLNRLCMTKVLNGKAFNY